MASGFFCVARARHFERGSEALTHHRIQGFRFDLHAVGPPHPLAQRLIRSGALWTTESLLKTSEDRGRQRDGFAGRDIRGQAGLSPACGIDGQPAADRMAMDPQQLGHFLAAVGLPTRQQVEHLQARLFVSIIFMLETLPELIDLFANAGGDSVHGLPSKRTLVIEALQGSSHMHNSQLEFI
jgi:hypothetical protein